MPVVLSDEELKAFHISEAEARLAIALKLYEDERVSLARAARIAGINRLQFQAEMAKRKIPIHYDLQMLEEDLRHAATFKQP
jgi:predicted HTH domain antitoxin